MKRVSFGGRGAGPAPGWLETSIYFAVGLAVLTSAQSRAEPEGASAGGGPAVSAPRLLEMAEAHYPEVARAEGREGTVVLRLTVNAEGQVQEAEVLEPAGHGFDEAAKEAALRSKFAPAQRDGQPVAARIRFPYAFHLAPAQPAPTAGDISGTLMRDGAPLAGAIVDIRSPRGEVSQLVTDAEGRFLSHNLAPGDYQVLARLGNRTAEGTAHVFAGTEAVVDLSLGPPVVSEGAVEVTVKGQTEVERLQRSAEAVNVIDTRRAQQQTADLGEVMARSQGVAVRREGGLGSGGRFALNGLYDKQIRFFLDGVPLELAGYPLGIENVPVNLVERVEVYRGVVPIRFGADALGGAVNLVSNSDPLSHAAGSYQTGSFGIHRMTLEGRHILPSSGFFAEASGFLDNAKNNYPVDAFLTNPQGNMIPQRLRRFHDGYRAWGGNVELGFADKPWAKLFSLQGFVSKFNKDIQSNLSGMVPYGEVNSRERVYGLTAKYQVEAGRGVELELLANASRRNIGFVDDSQFRYGWEGKPLSVLGGSRGEAAARSNQINWQNGLFGRALLKWTLSPRHILRFSTTPTFAARRGDERLQTAIRDPLDTKRRIFTLVSGVEYEVNALNDRLSNIVFIKDYVYRASTEELLPNLALRAANVNKHSAGVGDSLRYRMYSWLYAKASYEYATRLPQPDEVFGYGNIIHANLALEPEVSHNWNLGPRAEILRTRWGDFTVDINGFWRESKNLIALLGTTSFSTYENIGRVRGMGVENALSWTSPGAYLTVDGTFTYENTRNISTTGSYAPYNGDRMLHRPYLFASWAARGRLPRFLGNRNLFEPFYHGRYVHPFYLNWETVGSLNLEFKNTVPTQVMHSAGITWSYEGSGASFTGTFEVDNLTNAKVYDFFGVQKPGRAYYVKIGAKL